MTPLSERFVKRFSVRQFDSFLFHVYAPTHELISHVRHVSKPVHAIRDALHRIRTEIFTISYGHRYIQFQIFTHGRIMTSGQHEIRQFDSRDM